MNKEEFPKDVLHNKKCEYCVNLRECLLDVFKSIDELIVIR